MKMGKDAAGFFVWLAVVLPQFLFCGGCTHLIHRPFSQSADFSTGLSAPSSATLEPISDPFCSVSRARTEKIDDPFLALLPQTASFVSLNPPAEPAPSLATSSDLPEETTERLAIVGENAGENPGGNDLSAPNAPLGFALDVEEERKPLTHAAQAEVLAKDLWTPNLELARREKSGEKNPPKPRDLSELKRLENMLRHNMSDRDRQKQEKNLYEYSVGLISEWRWFHSEMERMAKSPRLSAETFLVSKKYIGQQNRVLRANAAILLGREGDERVIPYLLRVVENEEMSIYLRCAAVETLGNLEAVTVEDLLSLLDSAQIDPVQAALPPRIWEEILIALSLRIAPWEHDCFLEPFSSQNYDMRLAIAKLWVRQIPPGEVFGLAMPPTLRNQSCPCRNNDCRKKS